MKTISANMSEIQKSCDCINGLMRCGQCSDSLVGEGTTAEGQNISGNPKDRLGVMKPQLHLVPPASIIYEALAMENGAKKYGPYNWRGNPVKVSVYVSAAIRHLFSYWDGEDLADDSSIHHLAHAKACFGILIDAMETGNLIDDRPNPGVAANLIRTNTKHG